MTQNIVSETSLTGLGEPARGKVRDIYDLGSELLIVTTDRVSAYDVILPTAIPGKGEILTQMSQFWLDRINYVGNHLSSRPLAEVVTNEAERKMLGKRAALVKKAEPLPIEAVVRGYICGSGWKDYQNTGAICGIALPTNMKESEKFPEAIFTPATKAKPGEHDENISFQEMCKLIGNKLAIQVRDLSLRIYNEASSYAKERGIIIADTKFEFGLINNQLIIIDEALTPDSSRFWQADTYEPGKAQQSFDKQFVRDYLSTLDWDKTHPGPELPAEIVTQTQEKYQEAMQRLTINK